MLLRRALCVVAVASVVVPVVVQRSGFRPGTASDFVGQWDHTSDDGTYQEVIEFAIQGTEVRGELVALEHGYYSKRTTVKARLALRGSLANGALNLRVWNSEGLPNDARGAIGRLRGEYFVLAIGDEVAGYSRPGRPLVQTAERSPEAAALARAITGRVYSTSNQAGGRGGAIAGGRKRLALCADGNIEWDSSNLAGVPLPDGSASLGNSVARRGTWSIVLYAGEPLVRANWRGTGSSYSLTAYFRVEPIGTGNAAMVDGTQLPVTDRC